MTSARTKIGHGLAKFFNIELQKPQPYEDEVTRGESVYSTDTFVEQAPTAGEYFRELAPSGKEVLEYIKSLFPFLYWIGKYNMQWLAGDLVAGESYAHTPSLQHTLLTTSRYHHRCRRGPSGYGLCLACEPRAPVWPVLVLYGCLDLLVLCHF